MGEVVLTRLLGADHPPRVAGELGRSRDSGASGRASGGDGLEARHRPRRGYQGTVAGTVSEEDRCAIGHAVGRADASWPLRRGTERGAADGGSGLKWRLSERNDVKTREELIAEIEALKAELERQGSDAGKLTSGASSSPVFSAPITRRESLVTWVAPVILALPVVQAVGMVLKPGTARAARSAPSFKPTVAPSAPPSATPTQAGRCVVAPSAAPT